MYNVKLIFRPIYRHGLSLSLSPTYSISFELYFLFCCFALKQLHSHDNDAIHAAQVTSYIKQVTK
jgi:hypothetical protein